MRKFVVVKRNFLRFLECCYIPIVRLLMNSSAPKNCENRTITEVKMRRYSEHTFSIGLSRCGGKESSNFIVNANQKEKS